MGKLMNLYDGMKKQAEQEQLDEARLQVIYKYASAAEELLEKQYGANNYEAADVEKLAEFLINADLEKEESIEKVAEYDELGRIMARSFIDELQKNK